MVKISTREATSVTLLTTSLIIAAATLMINYHDNQAMAIPRIHGKGNYSFGAISSIQNDNNGNPAWIVSGHWKSNLLSNQSTSSSSQGKTSSLTGSAFDATVEMVKLDGTAAHRHAITNFTLAGTSMPNNMTRVFNGTSTASMREGPVTGIPTSIRIMGDKVISIWLDPSKIANHFGNTPIYGLVIDEHGNRQAYLSGNNTQIRR